MAIDAAVIEPVMDPVIATRSLTKHFGAVRALADLDLAVPRGSVFGFLGPNGSGKTTTIRLLLALVRPTSGEARILGQAVHPGAPVLGEVGALVERPAFYPYLSAFENLRVFAAARGLREPGARTACLTALERVGLADVARRKVGGFSTGMRQRLGIGLAMLDAPPIVILDEPTSGLDPEGTVDVRNLITGARPRRHDRLPLDAPPQRGGAGVHAAGGDLQGTDRDAGRHERPLRRAGAPRRSLRCAGRARRGTGGAAERRADGRVPPRSPAWRSTASRTAAPPSATWPMRAFTRPRSRSVGLPWSRSTWSSPASTPRPRSARRERPDPGRVAAPATSQGPVVRARRPGGADHHQLLGSAGQHRQPLRLRPDAAGPRRGAGPDGRRAGAVRLPAEPAHRAAVRPDLRARADCVRHRRDHCRRVRLRDGPDLPGGLEQQARVPGRAVRRAWRCSPCSCWQRS